MRALDAGKGEELSREDRIGLVCDEFEKELRTCDAEGRALPGIETFVNRLSDPQERAGLLRELQPLAEEYEPVWLLAPDGKESQNPISTYKLRRLAFAGEVKASDLLQRKGEPKLYHACSVLPGIFHIGDKKEYELLDVLGEGGMGIVYLAREKDLNRKVALKMLLAGQDGIQAESSFRQEAEKLAGLPNDHIVKIHKIGEHAGQLFFSLEYLEGGSLAQRMAEFSLPVLDAKTRKDKDGSSWGRRQIKQRLDKIARFMETLALATHAAHDKGVVHQDLKPQNVLLAKNEQKEFSLPKIADFGLARHFDPAAHNSEGPFGGTAEYMAPEQGDIFLTGKQGIIAPQTDVYALGAILYELLTGSPPFGRRDKKDDTHEQADRTSTRRFLEMVRDQPLTSPRQRNPTVPPDLEAICLKCLCKDPEQRYSSAQAVADDLSRFLTGWPVSARHTGRLERFRKWCGRNPLRTSLAASSFLLLFLSLLSVNLWVKLWGRLGIEQSKREKQAYMKLITRASQAWQDNKPGLARETLQQCPERARGLEYYYLDTLFNNRGQRTLPGHKAGVTRVVFSPDGKLLASAGKDQIVRIWSLEKDGIAQTFHEHTSTVHSVAFSPNGRLVASLALRTGPPLQSAGTEPPLQSASAELVIRDLRASRHISREVPIRWRPESGQLAFSPDGAYLVGKMGPTIVLWESATGNIIDSWQADPRPLLLEAWFSPDGKRLATPSNKRAIEIRETRTGVIVQTLPGHTLPVSCLAFSPDGRRLVSGSGNLGATESPGEIKLWDLETGKAMRSLIQASAAPLGLKYRAGDNTILLVSKTSQEVLSAELERQTLISRKGAEPLDEDVLARVGLPPCVALSADGTRYAFARRSVEVYVWEKNLTYNLALKGHTGAVTSLCFSPDNRWLASADDDGAIKIWDAIKGQDPVVLSWPAIPLTAAAFRPDGKRLARATESSAGRYRRELAVWDMEQGKQLCSMQAHNGIVTALAYNGDGTRLASGSKDRTTIIWDPETGERLHTLSHEGAVTCVAFAPKETCLASGSEDQTIKIWREAHPQTPLVLKGHSSPLTCVAFSRDGRTLASCDKNQTVILWDAGTGRLLQTFHTQGGPATCVAFTPDGARLVVACSGLSQREGVSIRFWDIETGQEQQCLRGHRDPIDCVAFSPDDRLISASQDAVKVWDVETGHEYLTLEVTLPVRCLGFPADSKGILGAGAGIVAWDAERKQRPVFPGGVQGVSEEVEQPAPPDSPVHPRAGGEEKIWTLPDRGFVNTGAFSPDGKYLASVHPGGVIKVWDLDRKEVIYLLNDPRGQAFEAVAFSHDGASLGLAARGLGLQVWSLRDGTQRFVCGPELVHSALAFSRDGKRIISSTSDGVKIWDGNNGREIGRLPKDGTVRATAISRLGKRLAIVNDKGLTVWDVEKHQQVATIQLPGVIRNVKFSFDEARIVAASLDPADVGVLTVTFWSASGNDPGASTKLRWPVGVTPILSPDGKYLVAYQTLLGGKIRVQIRVQVWDTQTGQEVASIDLQERVLATVGLGEPLIFSPDGKQIAFICNSRQIRIWRHTGDQRR